MSESQGDYGHPSLPPEMVEALHKHYMASEQRSHDITELIQTLDEGQLRTFHFFLHVVAQNPELTYMYSGIVMGELRHKFNVCTACGNDHDKMLEDLSPVNLNMNADSQSWANFVTTLPDKTINNLQKYRLQLIPQEWPKVRCDGCGLVYVSIEDRMIKEPDDCHGCHQRSATG